MSIELRSQHHLFRYASEWDPREKGKTKGGYLEGSIRLPPSDDGVKVVVSTYPAQLPPGLEDSCKDVHPTLLHLVRKTRARRMNELEPVPNIHHWRQELVVRGKEVTIVNKKSVADEGRDIPSTDKLFDLKDEQVLPFGKDAGELNLIILIPKSDARAQGDDVTLNNLLSNRIENKDMLKQMDENFKGKKSVNLKQVQLKVDFYKLSDDSHISSSISPTISDTASKQLGALDFHDATPLKSCQKGGRKVIMVAEFGLAPDVEPRFQLWDSLGNRLKEQEDRLLKQPKQPADSNNQQKETVAVFKESIIFITPDQPYLSTILENGFRITLAGRRKSDNWESRKKFPFTYVGCSPNCFYCLFNPDGGQSCNKGQAKLPLKKEGPRPGRKKRKMSETDEQGDLEMDPRSRHDSSRASTETQMTWSPNSEESVAVMGGLESQQSAVATCDSQSTPSPYSYRSFPVFSSQTQAAAGTDEVRIFGGGQTSRFPAAFQELPTYGGGATGPPLSSQSIFMYADADGNIIQQPNIILQDAQIGANPQYSEYTDNNTGGTLYFNSAEGDNAIIQKELLSIATQATTQVQNSLTSEWRISISESPVGNFDLSILSPPDPTPSPPHSTQSQASHPTPSPPHSTQSQASPANLYLENTDSFYLLAPQTNIHGATCANTDNATANTDGLHFPTQMDTRTEETLPKDIADFIFEDGGNSPNTPQTDVLQSLSTEGSSVENLQNVQEADNYQLAWPLDDIVQDGSCPQNKRTSVSSISAEPTRRVLVTRDTSTQEEDTEQQEEDEKEENEQPGFCERVLLKFSKLPLWFVFFFILAKWYWGDAMSFFDCVATTLFACIITIVVKDLVYGNIK